MNAPQVRGEAGPVSHTTPTPPTQTPVPLPSRSRSQVHSNSTASPSVWHTEYVSDANAEERRATWRQVVNILYPTNHAGGTP